VETFTAEVSKTRSLTHDVREIELTLLDAARIDFMPGQFVSFEVPRRTSSLPATRPYSIASSPNQRDAIQLVLNRVSGGPGSEYLFGLQQGDCTSFRGPAGTFVLRDSPRDLLFVATGTGIAPIRSMLRVLAEASSSRTIALFWGLRRERDLYYQDELNSQPSNDWRGAAGYVTPLVDAHVTDVANLEVFLCGNGSMIRDVRDMLRGKGLCPIRVEQYYR
jgi:CDP-4-dehydro-6-deoxyglucose reductase